MNLCYLCNVQVQYIAVLIALYLIEAVAAASQLILTTIVRSLSLFLSLSLSRVCVREAAAESFQTSATSHPSPLNPHP